MMTREEHLAWCKKRALEYLDQGDIKNAVASMGSDLAKHPETKLATSASSALLLLGMRCVLDGDVTGARRWIEGFN